ncbi:MULTISPECIES: excalibur calcium-binding domain-containing protein [Corynebacterium]|uniref:excalibur calcium-binding domain-containing protein n=1 Tax=Corynebacterium TaxID=1716 RepID=UPI001CEF85DA|nr:MULTISPECIES: excalibur calcium-binding domain-containing protein [Corynebacterium]
MYLLHLGSRRTIALSATALIAFTGLSACDSEDVANTPSSSSTTSSSSTSTSKTTEPNAQESSVTHSEAPAVATDDPVVGYTEAPGNAVPTVMNKTIRECGDPTLHETGTTFFTDETTGWTEQCASQMMAQRGESAPAPEPEPAQAATQFASCAEARAAGAAPLYKGDPGYSPKLDREGDGIACE